MGDVVVFSEFSEWKENKYKGEKYLEREAKSGRYKMLECISLSDGRWCMIFQSWGRDMYGFEAPTLGHNFLEWHYSAMRRECVCTYSEGLRWTKSKMSKYFGEKFERLDRANTWYKSEGWGGQVEIELKQEPTIYDGLRMLIERGYMEKILKTYDNPLGKMLHLFRKIGEDFEAPHERNRDVLDRLVEIFKGLYVEAEEEDRKEAQELLVSIWENRIEGDNGELHGEVKKVFEKVTEEMMRSELELDSAVAEMGD